MFPKRAIPLAKQAGEGGPLHAESRAAVRSRVVPTVCRSLPFALARRHLGARRACATALTGSSAHCGRRRATAAGFPSSASQHHRATRIEGLHRFACSHWAAVAAVRQELRLAPQVPSGLGQIQGACWRRRGIEHRRLQPHQPPSFTPRAVTAPASNLTVGGCAFAASFSTFTIFAAFATAVADRGDANARSPQDDRQCSCDVPSTVVCGCALVAC